MDTIRERSYIYSTHGFGLIDLRGVRLGPAFGSESDSEPEPDSEFDVVPVLCIPRPLFTVGVWVFFLSLCYYGYP
jgi:hypothetical protein